ncbi:MAG TPA: hypothetical protein VLX92_25080 [Kofleriaceae bacterium]|nr:hypothetical protein [Kofleriaceae bacterium]
MRLLLVLSLIAGCRDARTHAPSPQVHPVVLDAHAGATDLYGGEGLLMSFTQDWEKPGPLRLSRGRGPVARTLQGWPIGVVGDRGYVLEPAGDQERVLRVGLAGDPELLATIPAAPALYRNVGTVTGSGHVVLAISEGEKPTRIEVIAPDRTTRELSLVRDSDAIVALVGDPSGSSFALITSYAHGSASDQSAITLVDAATGATRWSLSMPPLWATEGPAAFVGDKLAVQLRSGIWGYDVATGATAKLLDLEDLDARRIAFGPRGEALAWVHWVHPSDVMPLSDRHACEVYAARAGEPAPTSPAISYETGCYFGTGVVFVGDALWVAPR